MRKHLVTNRQVANLHPRDIPLWLAVETAVWRVAIASKCKLKSVAPTPKKKVTIASGYFCFAPVSEIQISLRRDWFIKGKKEYWSDRYPLHHIIDTICHEVAHCVVGRENGRDHGPEFFRAFGRTLILSEDIGIRHFLDLNYRFVPKVKKLTIGCTVLH